MWAFVFSSQILSWALVSMGQPACLGGAAPIAAAIGYALHWRGLDRCSPLVAKKVSWLWFSSIQFWQLSWLCSIEYQGLFILLLYALLALGMGWQFSWMTRFLRTRSLSSLNFLGILTLAGTWTLMEWVRLYFFCGFPFNFIGLSLSANVFSLQMASLFGVLGLSFWVIITNLVGLRALRSPENKRCRVYFCLCVLTPYIYGVVSFFAHPLQSVDATQPTQRVLLVQTGLFPGQKYPLLGREQEFVHPILQWIQILEQLAPYKEDVFDAIIFPEAVLPYGWSKDIYDVRQVQYIMQSILGEGVCARFPEENSPVVSNQYWLKTLSCFFEAQVIAGLDYEEKGKNYSSVFYIQPEGEIMRYDKRILLPVAESMPFFFLKKISRFYGIEDFFSPGEKAVVWGKQAIAPCICYEELFPSLIRQSCKLGARWLVSLTNDGWYPYSSLAEQHFSHGLLRAVENGVPLVRCCHTGVTAVVNGRGEVLSRLGLCNEENLRGCLDVTFPLKIRRTLFLFWGQVPLIIFCLCVCGVSLYRNFFQKKEKKNKVFVLDKN